MIKFYDGVFLFTLDRLSFKVLLIGRDLAIFLFATLHSMLKTSCLLEGRDSVLGLVIVRALLHLNGGRSRSFIKLKTTSTGFNRWDVYIRRL